MFISSISPEQLAALQVASFPGKTKVIVKEGLDFMRAVSYLKHQRIIGFDTETRPCFSASQPRYGVSLLQLSGPDRAYLFRIKTLGMHKKLCSILADPKIVKVGAAVHDDIIGLQKYNGFVPASFVDLQKIVWEWGIKDKSVKKMAGIIMGFKISKTQQLSNWEAEVLSEAQIRYAATDAWVCREMYLKLMSSEKNPLQLQQEEPKQVSDNQDNKALK